MTRTRSPDLLGYVPSLEALPLFGGTDDVLGDVGHPLLPRAYSSYGNIARDLLTGTLSAGVLPLEIFIADLLALPSQQGQWTIPVFLHPCPMELVLGPQMTGFSSGGSRAGKLPKQMTVGVESRNSLAQMQVRAWAGGLPGGAGIRLEFKMLPMDLMAQALGSEAVDGIIAPTPWGLDAEIRRIGRLERGFQSGRFVQDLVMVQSRESVGDATTVRRLAGRLGDSRRSFQMHDELLAAASRMARHGRPVISGDLLEHAIREHGSFFDEPEECAPDASRLIRALENLAACSAMPAAITSPEETANSLLI